MARPADLPPTKLDTVTEVKSTRLDNTVAPTKLDTVNHCIMLERDYFEVLAVGKPGPFNEEQRTTLTEREGLWALALQTDDARAAHGRLKAAGFPPTDPVAFARPVEAHVNRQRVELQLGLMVELPIRPGAQVVVVPSIAHHLGHLAPVCLKHRLLVGWVL